MGFKDFCNSNNQAKQDKINQEIDKAKEKLNNDEALKKSEKEALRLFNKYKDYSEDELSNELLKHVEKQKKDGTFDMETISQMFEKLEPFLSQDQKERISQILNNLN